MAELLGFDLMGLTSLIEFSLQLFDYVNVARREKKTLIFLHVSCFHICMGGSPEQICSFLPMETLQVCFSPMKTNILLGTLPGVCRFSSDKNSRIFLAEALRPLFFLSLCFSSLSY